MFVFVSTERVAHKRNAKAWIPTGQHVPLWKGDSLSLFFSLIPFMAWENLLNPSLETSILVACSLKFHAYGWLIGCIEGFFDWDYRNEDRTWSIGTSFRWNILPKLIIFCPLAVQYPAIDWASKLLRKRFLSEMYQTSRLPTRLAVINRPAKAKLNCLRDTAFICRELHSIDFVTAFWK